MVYYVEEVWFGSAVASAGISRIAVHPVVWACTLKRAKNTFRFVGSHLYWASLESLVIAALYSFNPSNVE